MTFIGKTAARGLVLLAVGLFVAGCPLERDERDLRVAGAANPAAGPAVKITQITDKRVFEYPPSSGDVPSLVNQADYDKPEIKARAIARKRGGFGNALGDILLPQGRTVVQVVEDALAQGLREAGYRVVAAGDADYAAALPLQANVLQFWGWNTAGARIKHEGIIELVGNWPVDKSKLKDGIKTVRSYATNRATISNAVSEMGATMDRGVADLTAKLRDVLVTPN